MLWYPFGKSNWYRLSSPVNSTEVFLSVIKYAWFVLSLSSLSHFRDWKNYSIADLAQRFKGASARVIREKYPVRLVVKGLYGDSMWSDGYFHRTVGAVTTETMKQYVTESQKKHWTAKKPVQLQTTLLNCN